MHGYLTSGKRARGAALGASLLLVGGFVGAAVSHRVRAAEPNQTQLAATRGAASNALLADRTVALSEMENGFAAIAERMEPSVVSIRTKRTITQNVPNMGDFFRQFQGGQGGQDDDDTPGQLPFRLGPGQMGPGQMQMTPRRAIVRGAGSGLIVRADGWILTNDHVVDGADTVTVKLHDGREVEGTVRRDFRSDLALVKINASNLVPVDFADSDRVRVGQWAIAFGSPFALDDTMTLGIISARSRQRGITDGSESRFYPSLLQTDASINPGNSGGPLVDARGRVIGINVAINSPNGGNVGIGFAIPANSARRVMDQLMTKGRVTRGFLGFVPRALTPSDRDSYKVTTGGAFVETVSNDTPAAAAGLQPGDVITRFNGKPVADDIALRDMVANTDPGTRVQITVVRNGREQTLTATLEAAKDPQEMARQTRESAGAKLGIRVEGVTPESARKYNLNGVNAGVVVVEVQSGSAAEEAGLQPGDVIVTANGAAVRSQTDLQNAVSRLKSGANVNLVVLRDKARTLVSVRIP